MAHTQRVRRPLDDFIGLPCPPRTGAERLRWFDTLDRLLELDILNVRLQLRDAGLSPAAISAAMIALSEVQRLAKKAIYCSGSCARDVGAA